MKTEQHHADDALLLDAMSPQGAVSHGRRHLCAIIHETLTWKIILQGSYERLRGQPRWPARVTVAAAHRSQETALQGFRYWGVCRRCSCLKGTQSSILNAQKLLLCRCLRRLLQIGVQLSHSGNPPPTGKTFPSNLHLPVQQRRLAVFAEQPQIVLCHRLLVPGFEGAPPP